MGIPDSSSGGSAPPWCHQRGSAPELPPGFRFHPTDEELVVHYLKKKAANVPLPVTIITEVDLYKFDPWELPEKASFGEQEWYFFSPRERKYPNGARPNRATTSGYWKATGTDKPILKLSAVKKALVFYRGKPHTALKTNWIMHEYRLTDSSRPSSTTTTSLTLDDLVLCRIYKKINKAAAAGDQQRSSMDFMYCVEDAVVTAPYATAGMAPGGSDYTALLHHHDSHEADNYFLDGLLKAAAAPARVNPAAGSNQLLAPSSSTSTPFNWSTVGILPQAMNFPAGFNSSSRNVWLSSTADDMTCAVDNGGGNAVNTMPAFMNMPLPVQDGTTTYLQQHVILASSLPPEQATAAATSAFQQHPVQTFAGSWWNP